MNLTARKLGKLEPRHDPRTLQLANYLAGPVLPPTPAHVNWGVKMPSNWGMMGNDTIGCCTTSAAGHAIQAWTASNGKAETISDMAVLDAYANITGWNGNPATDTGAVELDVLNYWRKTGIGGHKLAAFAAAEPHNREHVRAACALFGGLYIGLALPLSAQSQHVWSLPPSGTHGEGAPRSWGGHAVYVYAEDASGLSCVTWGRRQRMTWSFWNTYCDESYALLSAEQWATPGHLAPSGFDLVSLQTDLSLL